MNFPGYLKKIFPIFFQILLLLLQFDAWGYSNLTNNDPYPLYTCIDPQDYLTEWDRARAMRIEVPSYMEHMQFAVNVFGQKAKYGTDVKGRTSTLGDLQGRWNILGLFYDPTTAQNLINNLQLPADSSCVNFITTPTCVDSNEQFGFFMVPVNYKKYGVRFQAAFQLPCDFGLKLDFGIVDIKQTASFVDLTCSASGTSCVGNSETPGTGNCATSDCCNNTIFCVESFDVNCKALVINDIMKQLCVVANTINLNIDDYHATGVEDIRLTGYWRRLFYINQDRPTYPEVIVMPFVTAEVGIPAHKKHNYRNQFEISPGNNGHTSAGMTAGWNVHFLESVNIGMEASVTKFFPLDFCNYRLPNDCFQSGIFPLYTEVKLHPGINWRFSAQMAAYHFIDRLSFFVQYCFISHSQDTICLKNPAQNNMFLIKRAEFLTKWESQQANSSLYYDVSPNIKLGFVWQAPLGRRNAYKTTTLMGSFVATF